MGSFAASFRAVKVVKDFRAAAPSSACAAAIEEAAAAFTALPFARSTQKEPRGWPDFLCQSPSMNKKDVPKRTFFPSTSFSAPPSSLLLCFSKFQQWKCIFHSMRMLPGSNFSRGNQFATQLSSLFCPTIVPLIMLIITFTVPADSLQKIPLRCFICNHPLC